MIFNKRTSIFLLTVLLPVQCMASNQSMASRNRPTFKSNMSLLYDETKQYGASYADTYCGLPSKAVHHDIKIINNNFYLQIKNLGTVFGHVTVSNKTRNKRITFKVKIDCYSHIYKDGRDRYVCSIVPDDTFVIEPNASNRTYDFDGICEAYDDIKKIGYHRTNIEIISSEELSPQSDNSLQVVSGTNAIALGVGTLVGSIIDTVVGWLYPKKK